MNLNSLPDKILFYSNDQFYKFIESYLGINEMNLLKLQSIKSIRTLIKVPDIFSVLTMELFVVSVDLISYIGVKLSSSTRNYQIENMSCPCRALIKIFKFQDLENEDI